MEALHEVQLDCYIQIEKFYINFKKASKDRLTKAYVETRLEMLDCFWKEFQARHTALLSCEEKESYAYFIDEKYEYCLELVMSMRTKIREHLETLEEHHHHFPKDITSFKSNLSKPNDTSVKLPPIHIPTFSGDNKEWLQFHDLFKSLVHDNPSINNVNKCYYLKSSLSGDAKLLVNQIQVSEANYETIWKLLNKRYNNKRSIINTFIGRLLNQRKLTSESPKGVRELLDTTNECLITLKSLDLPTEHWDDLIVHIIIQKLDGESHKIFEQGIVSNEELPKWSDLSNFLEYRYRALDSLKYKDGVSQRPAITAKSFNTGLRTQQMKCSYCHSEDHFVYKCKGFSQLNLRDRKMFVQNNSLCFNCLRKGHSVKACLQSTACQKCGRKHHSLIHGYVQNETETSQDSRHTHTTSISENAQVETATAIYTTESPKSEHSPVLLTTALVKVQSQRTNYLHTLRALVDQGSQACLITESACQLLGLARTPIKGNVTGVGSNKSITKSRVEFEVKSSSCSEISLKINAYVLKTLTSNLPQKSHMVNWPELRDIQLADPSFCDPGKIDIILGADVYAEILLQGVLYFRDKESTLIAQNTKFGWLVSGKSKSKSGYYNTIQVNHTRVEIDTLLKQFWEIEENHGQRVMTNLEIKCEKHYDTTHKRTEEGRYQVRLPFITYPPEIGESLSLATRRLTYLQRSFDKNPGLKCKYNEFMRDYLTQGHMEVVPTNEIQRKDVCYLPHHAVINEQSLTTKLRVVFNSSAKTSNSKSLNDNFMIGPPLQNNLRDVTLRWRRHKFVIIGDVRQMYRQIVIDRRDRDYLRILFKFEDPSLPDLHYRLSTVTYGTSCAPYLAIKTIKQLALDEKPNFEEDVIETALHDFYVDDLLTGRCTEEEVTELKTEMVKLMQKGGIKLHKWASNSPNIEGAEQDTRRILGNKWNGHTDKFELYIELPPVSNTISKRSILRDIAKIYDPAGWLAPVVVVAKSMLQKLWLNSLDWDDALPDPLLREWLRFRNELVNMPHVELNRWIGLNQDTIRVELHGFSDASTVAYSAVVYCRVILPDQIIVTLLEAKTRVAPVKQISVARLELCGAVLLAKLMKRIHTALNIPDRYVYAWTDAMIVLAWLQRSPSYWTTFVANRVTEIINAVDKERWNHVVSSQNPADVASRGISPAELPTHELWWRGPLWLHEFDYTGPTETSQIEPTELECKKSASIIVNVVSSSNDSSYFNFFCRYSNLCKLIRIVVYIKRFFISLKHRVQYRTNLCFPCFLTTDELNKSLITLVKLSQSQTLSKEIEVLKGNGNNKVTVLKRLDNGRKIVSLNPCICKDDLLRVGGRVEFSNLSMEMKHPVILVNSCTLSYLIVRDAHCRTLHGGVQLMLNYIRTKFHIIGVRYIVKNVIHNCVTCSKVKGKLCQQQMGNLPVCRVTPQRPFLVSGVDFAGPVTLKLYNGRGSNKTLKAYIAVFICTAVKAVHLELVTSLSSEAFLAAFRRFVARRGHCRKLISDCGTNFVGASKELRVLFDLGTNSLPLEISSMLAKDGTEWQFNPPGAPHMGGLWEAAVKSTKFHLNRVLNDCKLTYEEYSTLLCQIESCLNSRPLTPLNECDGTVIEALTPGHFLLGENPIVVPEGDYTEVRVPYSQRWVFIQQKLQLFWKKWSLEYLTELQKRYKWAGSQSNIKIGDVVLIKDERLPPAKWSMGRVLDVHPGADQLVRVVTVRTRATTIKRPIHKLCVLPVA